MARDLLIVDDESSILRMMKTILESHGYAVQTARSASEAELHLRDRSFDLVLTDMKMETDAAGYRVVRAAKAQPHRPAVVILTAFPVLARQWRQEGADALMSKPASIDQLLQKLAELGGGSASRTAD